MGSSDGNSGLRMTGEGRGGGLRRALQVWLVVLILLLVTGAIVVRLDGGRKLICGFLEKRFGAPVEIGHSRIAWPYDLVLENIRVEFHETGSLSVAELRFGLGGAAARRLVLHNPELVLLRDERGTWAPQIFSALGTLPAGSFHDITELTKPWRNRISLRVTDGALRWMDHSGEIMTEVNGLRFAVRPVKLLNREYFAYEWGAYVIRDSSGLSAGDPYCLWLAGAYNDYIELERRVAAGPGRGWPHIEGDEQ